MMNVKRSSSYYSIAAPLIITAVTLLSGIGIASAWTGPTATPPGNNASAPINVSATAQSKSGQLSVEGLNVFGNTLLGGAPGSYLNFGATAGTGGYGIWDNGGVLNFKNSGGTWQSLQSVISTYVTNNTSGISGSGTASYIPLFSATSTLGNSIISQSGANLTVAGTLTANTTGNWAGYFTGQQGLYGYSRTGTPSNEYAGVEGESLTGFGIYGVNDDDDNWAGYFTGGDGVYADAGSGGIGVEGQTSGSGSYGGYFEGSQGVYGYSLNNNAANDDAGVIGESKAGLGVYGINDQGNNWGGYFTGGYGVYSANGAGYYTQLDNGSYGVLTNGNVAAAAFLYNSDERLKKNIEPLTGNLAAVMRLEPVSYNWINPASGTTTQIGFIAQAVQEVVPEIVHTDPKTTLESVDYARMTPLLVGSVQELDQKIEAQQTQIDTQQEEINELQAQIQALQDK